MMSDITIILEDPLYSHNLASAIRAAACFGVKRVLWTGDRFDPSTMDRLPREERMKGYRSVEVINTDRPFDLLGPQVTPICVELTPHATPLPIFPGVSWPVAYVFGPEDGGVSQAFRGLCHHFVYIPAYHCLNLAVAMGVVLYNHRMLEWGYDEQYPSPAKTEGRGIIEVPGWEGK